MAPTSAPARIIPADGEAFLISRIKRAPGLEMILARPCRAGVARARRASIETPAKRASSSARFTSAILTKIPVGSAIARLDELVEQMPCPARSDRFQSHSNAVAQAPGFARRHQ